MKLRILALPLLLALLPAGSAQADQALSPYKVQEMKVEQPRIAVPKVQQMKVEAARIAPPKVQEIRVEQPVIAWPRMEGAPAGPAPGIAPPGGLIAVSDFKKGSYSLYGRPVPYEALWGPGVGLGSVVPGIGWTYSTTQRGIESYIPATAVLNDAMRRDGGITVVMDCSIETPDEEGARTVSVGLGIWNDPTDDHVAMAGAWHDPPSWGGTGGEPPFMGTTNVAVTFYITLGEIHRFASILSGAGEYMSVDGLPVQHGDAIYWGGDMNAMYLDSVVEPDGFGPQRVVVERIAFYRLVDPKKLPAMSRTSEGGGSARARQGGHPRPRRDIRVPDMQRKR